MSDSTASTGTVAHVNPAVDVGVVPSRSGPAALAGACWLLVTAEELDEMAADNLPASVVEQAIHLQRDAVLMCQANVDRPLRKGRR